MYTGAAEITTENVVFVVEQACKWQVDPLVEICSTHLTSNMDVTSVANVLATAEKFDLDSLRSECVDFVCQNIESLRPTLKDLSIDSLLLVPTHLP